MQVAEFCKFIMQDFACITRQNCNMLRIRQIRESKNLTQDKVCEMSGIPKRTYVNYEAGKADVPFSKLQIIASVLGVSITDLIEEKAPVIDNKHIQIANGNNNHQSISQVRHNNELLHLEIAALKRENELLRDMVNLLKKK
jgi:transcriptional regulator with XRE-family HTH domain